MTAVVRVSLKFYYQCNKSTPKTTHHTLYTGATVENAMCRIRASIRATIIPFKYFGTDLKNTITICFTTKKSFNYFVLDGNTYTFTDLGTFISETVSSLLHDFIFTLLGYKLYALF